MYLAYWLELLAKSGGGKCICLVGWSYSLKVVGVNVSVLLVGITS